MNLEKTILSDHPHKIFQRFCYSVVLIFLVYLLHFFQHDQFLVSRRLDITVKKFRTSFQYTIDSNHIRTSDKINGHGYFNTYGKYLHSAIMDASHSRRRLKLLEIGLGCGGHPSGRGASIELWKRMYPHVELWVAEYDSTCVAGYFSKLNDMKVSVVIGDKSNPTDLHRWIQETGGEFDFIIDDGGHTKNHILASFKVLFQEALNPGGVYFIEDLHVGRTARRWFKKDEPEVSDVLKDWMDQLLIESPHPKYPIPKSVKSIGCQREACVIEKEDQAQ